MNWKIRIKNPVFWVQIALGAFATALAYAGLTAADMTTWAGVWQIIKGHGGKSVLPVFDCLQCVVGA